MTSDAADHRNIRYENPAERVARVVLARPDTRNAQDTDLLYELGMVNHVVDDAELSSFTLALASRIAEQPLFALRLAKEAVNAAQDAQGRVGAMQTSSALHQLCHSHNGQVHGTLIDPSFLDRQKEIAGRWR